MNSKSRYAKSLSSTDYYGTYSLRGLQSDLSDFVCNFITKKDRKNILNLNFRFSKLKLKKLAKLI